MITYLKLGGSLITDKATAHRAKPQLIERLGREIAAALPSLSANTLIIGHGSGSFGHIPAKKYNTRNGVHSENEWKGFAEVHAEAAALNQIVTSSLRKAGLPCISFCPLHCVTAEQGQICSWDIAPIQKVLSEGLIPIVYGDTVFDRVLGGTIVSTEELFVWLCDAFAQPSRILLAGLEKGVWRDFPQNTLLIKKMNLSDTTDEDYLQQSAFTDVTGGMREKVRLMKTLILSGKTDQAQIFSGIEEGNTTAALRGENSGTIIFRTK